MKFIFITQEDPFYIKLFFESFFKNYAGIGEVQAVIICKTMGKSMAKLAQQMYGFYGPIDFCRMGLRYASNKIMGSISKHSNSNVFFDIGHICKHYNTKVLHWDRSINDPEMVDMLRKMGLDIIVSVAAPHIFKADIINVPKRGCINIHNAKIPNYRGMLPNFWNMYHDEKTSAITIHTMDLEIDRGKILLQHEFKINPTESLDQLIKRTKQLSALYLIEALESIKNGTAVYKAQDDIKGSYFSFPTPTDVKKFRSMGKRLL